MRVCISKDKLATLLGRLLNPYYKDLEKRIAALLQIMSDEEKRLAIRIDLHSLDTLKPFLAEFLFNLATIKANTQETVMVVRNLLIMAATANEAPDLSLLQSVISQAHCAWHHFPRKTTRDRSKMVTPPTTNTRNVRFKPGQFCG